MQAPLFGDMVFRSNGMSEDCLYLNVWTPGEIGQRAPTRAGVLLWRRFVAGDGSEPRYDGESMAKKGIVALTVNYRLGVFGFMAHPDLTRESPHHASGNYALLDQNAALEVGAEEHRGIRRRPAKGDDCGGVGRIDCGQRADGVSAVKGLIAGAIGESGALIAPTLPAGPAGRGRSRRA